MIRRIIVSALLFLSALTLGIGRVKADMHYKIEFTKADFDSSKQNVVLITLDGVRAEEALSGFADNEIITFNPFLTSEENKKDYQMLSTPLFPKSIARFSKEGVILDNMIVSNLAKLSLPAYQNIMAGFVQKDCLDNKCGSIQIKTLPERLADIFLNYTDVAVVASWSNIKQAVTRDIKNKVSNDGKLIFIKNKFLINTGVQPLQIANIQNQANELQANDLPSNVRKYQLEDRNDVRKDIYTIMQAKEVIKSFKPRFLFISLNDTDAAGHEHNYPKYLSAMINADRWIEEIEDTLWVSGYNKETTTIIVTTDHGRGNSRTTWGEHASYLPGSEKLWLMAKGPTVTKQTSHKHNTIAYDHSSIRPTIEAIFGLKPCAKCGKPIEALIHSPDSNSDLISKQ